MDGFWVRQQGRQFWAGDLDALLRMVAEGRLGRDDEVHTGDRWEKARDFDPIKTRFGVDPFEAWSDADTVDPASAYARYIGTPGPRAPERPADPGARELRVLPRPSPDSGRQAASAASAPALELRPVEVPPALDLDEPTDPGPVSSPSLPGGEVIEFPRIPLPRAITLEPERRPRPPGPTPLIRTSRLMVFVAVGVAFLLVYLWWIRLAATSRSGISEAPPPPAPKTSLTAPSRLAAAGETDIQRVERELRSTLSGDPRAISGPGALGDSLLIEIQRLRVDVERVDAPVQKWTGRDQSQPATANVAVVLGTSTELDRSVGAIALVVGRYKRTYRLDIPSITIAWHTDEGDRRLSVSATRAEEFYVGRLSLTELLSGP